MKSLLLIIMTILCTSCDSDVLWLDEPYEVHWINKESNRKLAYNLGNGSSIGRVKSEVIAVGSNEFYVVVKQKNISTHTANYYYIERKKDDKYYDSIDITKGPYNSKEFSEINSLLKLPEFTKIFE